MCPQSLQVMPQDACVSGVTLRFGLSHAGQMCSWFLSNFWAGIFFRILARTSAASFLVFMEEVYRLLLEVKLAVGVGPLLASLVAAGLIR